MRFYQGVLLVLFVGGVVASTTRISRAEEEEEHNNCGPDEVQHKVASGDTIGRIAERYYCVDGDWSSQPIAQWLSDHNRSTIGEDRTRVYPGTLLCLPERFHGATWVANRCWPERPATPQADKPVADKPVPVVVEACRAETIEHPNKGVAIVEKLSDAKFGQRDQPVAAPEKKRKVLRRVSAEVFGGALVPFSSTTRNGFYQALGLAGVGARITLGIIDIAPRLLFVGNNFGTTYNGQPAPEQSLLGGGGAAQIGLALGRGAWRFTPGIEGGWIGVRRNVTRTSYPDEGTVATNLVGLSMAGVFLRPEYRFSSNSGLNVAVEVGGDVVAFYGSNGDLDAGVNGRISGGVGYAF